MLTPRSDAGHAESTTSSTNTTGSGHRCLSSRSATLYMERKLAVLSPAPAKTSTQEIVFKCTMKCVCACECMRACGAVAKCMRS
eukprot:5791467-Amphidinium_carterae.2